MNSSKRLHSLAAALAPLALLLTSGCESLEPDDPKIHMPGRPQYYNQALGFSLRYPGVLNLQVKDTAAAGTPGVSIRLVYPGNEQVMFRLSTYDPAMGGHVRQYMVPGSEQPQPVGDEMGSRFLIEDQGSDEAGATLQHVTVERDSVLYVMSGKGETFDEIVNSFEFLEPRRAAP